MKSIILLGRKRGSAKIEVVAGPSQDGRETLALAARFKTETSSGTSNDFELLEQWDSASGRVKSRKLSTPKTTNQTTKPKTVSKS